MNAELYFEMPAATNDGEFMARYSENGLVKLDFPKKKPAARTKQKQPPVATVPSKIRNWHRQPEAALHLILSGRQANKLPPLDWFGKTEFQQSVWRELLKISSGETRSYGEVARQVGRPKAVRAVGGACGANPVPVLVPCHRVLAANRKLGGFSGGLDWKRTLLTREGIRL